MVWGSKTAEERGYGWAWRKLRAQVLIRDRYLCQVSLKQGRMVEAQEVDHIVSKAEWQKRHGHLDGVDHPSNLQAISREEHEKKSLMERGYQVKTEGALNGLPTNPDHPWNSE